MTPGIPAAVIAYGKRIGLIRPAQPPERQFFLSASAGSRSPSIENAPIPVSRVSPVHPRFIRARPDHTCFSLGVRRVAHLAHRAHAPRFAVPTANACGPPHDDFTAFRDPPAGTLNGGLPPGVLRVTASHCVAVTRFRAPLSFWVPCPPLSRSTVSRASQGARLSTT
jgi:hypothetical protein